MVGKPAEDEGSHQDRNRAGYHSAVLPLRRPASPRTLWKSQQQQVVMVPKDTMKARTTLCSWYAPSQYLLGKRRRQRRTPHNPPSAPKVAVGTVTRAAATFTARVTTHAQKTDRCLPGLTTMASTQYLATLSAVIRKVLAWMLRPGVVRITLQRALPKGQCESSAYSVAQKERVRASPRSARARLKTKVLEGGPGAC